MRLHRTLTLLTKRLVADRLPSTKINWRRVVVRGWCFGLALALLVEVIRVLFVGNVHTVIPGRVFRSAQLTDHGLRELIRANGIRTVINLRGCNAGVDWYQNECRLVHDLNISQEDVTFSANRLPPRAELRRLIEVFDRTEYPIVLHCKQGADRTGLASAAWLLLYTDMDYATARRQCGPRYAHVPLLSTTSMDRFFDMYEDWLASRQFSHSPAAFRHWALEDYRPDPAPARLELLDPIPTLAVNEPVTLRIRAHNLSNSTWQFKTGLNTGIHVRYQILNDSSQSGLAYAGQFEARIAPGDSINVSLPFRGFPTPGTYLIRADLANRNIAFSQLGSEPLVFEMVVRDHQGR